MRGRLREKKERRGREQSGRQREKIRMTASKGERGGWEAAARRRSLLIARAFPLGKVDGFTEGSRRPSFTSNASSHI